MPSERRLALLALAILSELPDGWRVRRCRRRWGGDFGGSGLCSSDAKLIEIPWPPTHVETLAVIAHEVAHSLLHDEETRGHVMEYEAELWSFRWLRARGLRVPRFYQSAAQRNVSARIREDMKAGVKIRRTIRRWAQRRGAGRSPCV